MHTRRFSIVESRINGKSSSQTGVALRLLAAVYTARIEVIMSDNNNSKR